MAPLRSEPSSLKAVLGPARREALRQLIGEITAAHMRPRLELGIDDDDDNGRAKGTACLIPPAPEASEATEAALEAPTWMTEIPMPTPEPGPPRHGHGTADAELVALRASALAHFDEWKENVVANLKRMLEEEEEGEKDRKRREERRAVPEAERDEVPPSPGIEENHPLRPERDPTMTTSSDETRDYWERAVEAHQAIYPPVPTSLATLPAQDRTEMLRAMLFFLLSMGGGGGYSSYSRTLLVLLASALALPLAVLNQAEKEIMATTMLQMSSSSSQAGETRRDEGLGHHQHLSMAPSRREEEVQQQEDNRASSSRLWKVGLASAAGAAALGVTGGLAGPVVAGAVGGLMGSAGLGGLASVLGVFWTKGALVGTLFGAVGAGMTGSAMDKYARDVPDFKFLPVPQKAKRRPPDVVVNNHDDNMDDSIRRLRVTIGIHGWLSSEDQVREPWRVFGDDTEVFALRYEVESLLALGQALQDKISSSSPSQAGKQTSNNSNKAEKFLLPPRAVLTALGAAARWPVAPLLGKRAKAAARVDDTTLSSLYHQAETQAEKTGQVLAQVLTDKVQGGRPVTLVGYALGARVLASCLETLAARRAFGLVETVVLVGQPPFLARSSSWQAMRSVVAGNIFHVFSRDNEDTTLALLGRSKGGAPEDGIAQGPIILQPKVRGVQGLVHVDLDAEARGEHLDYCNLSGATLGAILKRCGFVDILSESRSGEEEEVLPALTREENQSENNIDNSTAAAAPKGKQREPKDDNDDDPGEEAPLVSPVPVKPRGKKSHRQISFPSGISKAKKEPPPVVQMVTTTQSVGVSPASSSVIHSGRRRKTRGGPSHRQAGFSSSQEGSLRGDDDERACH